MFIEISCSQIHSGIGESHTFIETIPVWRPHSGVNYISEFSGNYKQPVFLTLNHEVTIVEFSNMSIKLISKWQGSDRRAIRLVYDVIISSQFRVKLFAWFHFLISRTLVSASLIEICILKSLSCILRIFL